MAEKHGKVEAEGGKQRNVELYNGRSKVLQQQLFDTHIYIYMIITYLTEIIKTSYDSNMLLAVFYCTSDVLLCKKH